jgi:tetratricopeptide (TPR) repeat protein
MQLLDIMKVFLYPGPTAPPRRAAGRLSARLRKIAFDTPAVRGSTHVLVKPCSAAVLLLVVAASPSARAGAGGEPSSRSEMLPLAPGIRDPEALRPTPEILPPPTGDEALEANPELRERYAEGLALEQRDALLASNERYEAIAEALPESAFIRWRISRNYWRLGEELPVDAKSERLRYFGRADVWADRALAADPDCAPCMLWKVAAMGRLATTGNVFEAAGKASTIAGLIERGIALQPTQRDSPWNTTLGNLYYAGAAFYRILPDWFWLEWVLGVRGDRERSLEYIHKALEISNQRVDYWVELGAVLLCIGSEKHDAQRLAEGRAALLHATRMKPVLRTDPVDAQHARVLLAEPGHACGYSRDGWIDMGRAREVREALARGSSGR